jgi:hypothetical protein
LDLYPRKGKRKGKGKGKRKRKWDALMVKNNLSSSSCKGGERSIF